MRVRLSDPAVRPCCQALLSDPTASFAYNLHFPLPEIFALRHPCGGQARSERVVGRIGSGSLGSHCETAWCCQSNASGGHGVHSSPDRGPCCPRRMGDCSSRRLSTPGGGGDAQDNASGRVPGLGRIGVASKCRLVVEHRWVSALETGGCCPNQRQCTRARCTCPSHHSMGSCRPLSQRWHSVHWARSDDGGPRRGCFPPTP